MERTPSNQTPEQQAETKRLATPEGLKELAAKVSPLTLSDGSLPVMGKPSVNPVDARPVGDREAFATFNLPGSDFVLFTLAPVYFTVKVPFDIITQFLNSEHGKDAQVRRLRLPFQVTPDISGWENVVECVNRPAWANLVLFLGECAFQRNQQYWTVCGDMVTIPLVTGGVAPLAVFTPRGLAIRFRPYVDDKGCVRFSSENVFESFNDSDYVRKLSNISTEGKR